MAVIEPDPGLRREVHLILILDEPLFEISLAAAQSAGGERLYEQ